MVEAPIDRVRIYHQGATVTRRVALQAPLPAELEFGALPLAILDETVQIRCLGTGVMATGLRIGLHAKGPDQMPEDPERDALRAVERRIALQQDQIDQIDAECQRLQALQVPSRPRGKEGRPPPPSPMRARVALEQFTDTAIGQRLSERRVLIRSLELLHEEQASLENAIAVASSAKRAASHRITKTVRAEISGSATGEVVFELDYFVPGARWAPQYRLDIAPDGSGATLALRALICQASGEDWRSVSLELSTAMPTQFTELPKLASIRIGKRQGVPTARGYRAPPKGASALFAGYDRDRRTSSALLPSSQVFEGPTLVLLPPEPLRSFGAAADSYDLDDEAEAVWSEEEAPEAMRLSAAAAPPPSVAPAAAPRRRSKKMAAQKPRPGKRKEMAKGALKSKGVGGASRRPPAARFTQLRLGAADARGSRGGLSPTHRQDEYLERLASTGLIVDFDVVERVEAAIREASGAASFALPDGAISVRDAAQNFDYAYRAQDRVDVPSDKAFHSIPLGSREAPCALTYVVVPREDVNVFRMARITNVDASPLLPGPAEVYVDGEYVLTTQMPMVAPSAKFELGLGVEQAIRCVRNTRFRESRSGKAVVAMAELEHTIAIELVNHLARDVSCEVRERIPQPGPDAEVDVEEVEVEPPWEVWDQAKTDGPKLLGGRHWTVTVPSAGEVALTARYVVKIYANNEITGGNRREA